MDATRIGDGADGSLAIRQDARLLQLRLEPGKAADFVPDGSRLYWLQVVSGAATANGGIALRPGDALALRDESGTLRFQGAGDEPALLVLLDLPE